MVMVLALVVAALVVGFHLMGEWGAEEITLWWWY